MLRRAAEKSATIVHIQRIITKGESENIRAFSAEISSSQCNISQIYNKSLTVHVVLICKKRWAQHVKQPVDGY